MTDTEILILARNQTKMTQREFSEYFGIPIRTLQDWEYKKRKIAKYLLRLMIYKLETENLVKNLQGEILENDGEEL